MIGLGDGEGASPLSIRAKSLVFVDPASWAVLDLIERVAPSGAPVMIEGDSAGGGPMARPCCGPALREGRSRCGGRLRIGVFSRAGRSPQRSARRLGLPACTPGIQSSVMAPQLLERLALQRCQGGGIADGPVQYLVVPAHVVLRGDLGVGATDDGDVVR